MVVTIPHLGLLASRDAKELVLVGMGVGLRLDLLSTLFFVLFQVTCDQPASISFWHLSKKLLWIIFFIFLTRTGRRPVLSMKI